MLFGCDNDNKTTFRLLSFCQSEIQLSPIYWYPFQLIVSQVLSSMIVKNIQVPNCLCYSGKSVYCRYFTWKRFAALGNS